MTSSMWKSSKWLVTGLCLIAFVTLSEAARPLECYHCSSETIGSEDFCGQTFQEDKIPDALKKQNLSVVRLCNASSEHLIPTCRKTLEEKNGIVVTKRFCYYTNRSDSVNCNDPHDNSRIFCQDCFSDRCNSANHRVAQQMSFIAIPLLLSKLPLL